MKEIAGRTAFITGGASGIGLGMARAFVAAGMQVVITYRSEEHLRSALTHFDEYRHRIHAIQLEVTDREAMERAAEEAQRVFGNVHILCNNAAVGIMVPVAEATFADWDWALGVNLGGVINGIQTFLPRMRAHGEESHILSTASMGGLFIGSTVGIYNTTKYAVVGLMEALRADLVGTGIGASVLCPGLVNTDIHLTEKSRPQRYARSSRSSEPDPQRAQWFKQNVLALGMDPLELGTLALQGIRRNDLYILTHPEYEIGIRERFEAILASLPRDVSAPQQRVQAEARVIRHPMYALERDRRAGQESGPNT